MEKKKRGEKDKNYNRSKQLYNKLSENFSQGKTFPKCSSDFLWLMLRAKSWKMYTKKCHRKLGLVDWNKTFCTIKYDVNISQFNVLWQMRRISGLNVQRSLTPLFTCMLVIHLNSNKAVKCLFSQQLENSLNDFGEKWVLNPGDGAFYGPKVSHAVQMQ